MQITVIRDKPITVSLTGGNSKSALRKWRDSMSYVILERPSHGRLNEYTTLKDSITYTPNPGMPIHYPTIDEFTSADLLNVVDYLGTDFFTYQIQLGGISTAPATVSLSIEEYDENTDYEALNKVQQAAARRKSSLISTGLPSRKGSTYSQPGDDDMDEDFERDIEADVTETNTEKNRRKSSRKYNPSPPPSPNTRSVRYKSIELTDQKDKSNTNSNNRNSKRVSSRATSPPRQQSMRKSVEKSDATENKEESWHSSHEVHTSNSPFVQGLMKKMTSENKKEKDKNVDGDDSRV